MAADEQGGTGRDRYRDDDDQRERVAPEERNAARGDSRSEARGDARDDVGGTARGTDARPTSGGNDRQRASDDASDAYDDDLARDNRRGREGQGMGALADDARSGAFGASGADRGAGDEGVQHARKGQAQSPAERTHNEPRPKVQGHGRKDGK